MHICGQHASSALPSRREPLVWCPTPVPVAGELLNKAEKQWRVEEQARAQALDFYMMEHSPGVIIDARIKGNLARLINSSCDPNCETQKWRDAATDEVSHCLDTLKSAVNSQADFAVWEMKPRTLNLLTIAVKGPHRDLCKTRYCTRGGVGI